MRIIEDIETIEKEQEQQKTLLFNFFMWFRENVLRI